MYILGKIALRKRQEKKITRAEVAEKTGISVRTLKNIECSETKSVSVGVANALAEALGCGITELLQGQEMYRIVDSRNALTNQEIIFLENLAMKYAVM